MRYILTSSLVVRIVRNSSARRFCSRPKKEVPQQIDFDTLGIWDNRIDWPLLLQQSIKHGKPIPQISIKNAGYASVSGRRPTNEDRYRCRELAQDLLYLAVFDGHGGPQCAGFASQHLESHILSKLHRGQMDLRAILRTSFLELNTAFQEYVQRESDFQAAKSGTTATVVLLRNSMELVVGHVGDSRVLLCRDGEVRKLTTDHTDDVEEEEERVLQAGGTIKHDDTTGRGLVNGRLAMTRSLGDLELKPYGVVADPETKSLEVKHSKDSCMILTTDGVNNVMTNQEIGKLAMNCDNPAEAASLITDMAMQYGSDDNATTLVLPLGAWGKFRPSRQWSPLPRNLYRY